MNTFHDREQQSREATEKGRKQREIKWIKAEPNKNEINRTYV